MVCSQFILCLCGFIYITFQTTLETGATGSAASDDNGIVISKEDLEKSTNQTIVQTYAPLLGKIDAKLIHHVLPFHCSC